MPELTIDAGLKGIGKVMSDANLRMLMTTSQTVASLRSRT